MSKIIKTSKHFFAKNINFGKDIRLAEFVSYFRSAVIQYVDFIWSSKFEQKTKSGVQIFDIKNERFNLPTFLSLEEAVFLKR